MKLDSIAPPLVGVGLTGDLKAGICNHVHTMEVAWRERGKQSLCMGRRGGGGVGGGGGGGVV